MTTTTDTPTEKTYCARNYRSIPGLEIKTHVCTGGRFCKGNCKPRKPRVPKQASAPDQERAS